MSPRARLRPCSVPGCPTLTRQGRCQVHERAADRARGTAAQRGYNGAGHRRFREAVLRRDPWCKVCGVERSTVADHWPRSRRELVALGLDPNDPKYGRGLCASDHGRETAASPSQRGGWNAR